MEKYENVEKRVGRDNTPQLQAENSTAEGLNIIKANDAGRAAGSNDHLPKLELFGDLEKKFMTVSIVVPSIG